MQKLAKKLIAVMQECRYVAKNGVNTFHKYKYATCADVLEMVNAAFVKHGIASITVPEVVDLHEVTTAKGSTEHIATVKITIKLVDADSGESLEISGMGSGQDSGDKAVMKAQTAAIKYAYLLSFAISTGDDPEADQRTDERSSASSVLSTASTSRAFQQKSNAKGQVHACHECGEKLTERVATFSMQRYGRPLCMDCQKQAAATA
ncbi:single-stranded DNA-binding protein [Selenomonas sp. oral taxon 126]|uniref:ERF family protein n=1 Tax=Selenomonas sp. oral taxon 126 TaxID=712528 RepID=UPI0008079DFA|nr:ERF family protein [Selenomonas sp. oral taxon 126]ANR70338.1 single-stranded DNA-binding protein [Selenomonas sp. oral taxon 126]